MTGNPFDPDPGARWHEKLLLLLIVMVYRAWCALCDFYDWIRERF